MNSRTGRLGVDPFATIADSSRFSPSLFALACRRRTRSKGNEIALALYKGIGFELAAVEDDELARRRRRASRVYLRKSLA